MSIGLGTARSTFDEARWPIVVVTLPRLPLEGAAFDEHCRNVFRYFERGESFAWVFDVRDVTPLSAAQRRIIAEQTDLYLARYPDVRCFSAVILTSAVQRGIVKAFQWMIKNPVPTSVFASLEEGIAWTDKALREERRVKR